MFALIDTKGANKIAIHIPNETAGNSLPQLAKMLESNATFIKNHWNEVAIVDAEMTVVLGDVYSAECEGNTLKIQESGAIIDEGFEVSSPDLLVSNKEQMKKLNDEKANLAKELSLANAKLEEALEKIAELETSE